MKLKGVKLQDILIIVLMLGVIYFDMNFKELETLDYVCLGAFAFWILAFIARIYISNKEEK